MNATTDTPPDGSPLPTPANSSLAGVTAVLRPLASLRLTVVLLALSVLLVFFGTLAQMDNGIWKVVDDYFWSYFVQVKFNLFAQFAKVFLPGVKVGSLSGSFPFPAGKTLGGLMLLNLLAAHLLRFRLRWNRSGILLIHSGIALMLAGEWITREKAVEQRMQIEEGTGTNYTFSLRLAELAIVDVTDPNDATAAVLPFSLMKSGDVIRDARLPLDVEVVGAYASSDVVGRRASDDSPADTGYGKQYKIKPVEAVSGVEDQSVDIPSAYVRLFPKGGDKPVGTYLFSVLLANVGKSETVEAGGRKYEVSLRLKRYYKPFTVFLSQFRFDRYLGTNTAKNYSSDVVLVDLEKGSERTAHISMNDPLRYEEEAYFQADFDKQSERITILQVVRNPGWLIPYLSCLIVGLGMVVHFGITLPGKAAAIARTGPAQQKRSAWDRFVPPASLAIVGVVLIGAFAPLFVSPKPYDVNGFARLPAVDGGRLKPLDTVARTTLRVLSFEERVKNEKGEKISAALWLLEAVSRGDERHKGPAFRYQTIRIDNEQVLNELKLKNRDGFRYSLEEIEPSHELIADRAMKARQKPKNMRDLTDQKFLDLYEKLTTYYVLATSRTPLVIPPRAEGGKWLTYEQAVTALAQEAEADVATKLGPPPTPGSAKEVLEDYRNKAQEITKAKLDADPALKTWTDLIWSYRQQKPDEFNTALAEYRKYADAALTSDERFKIGLEVAYNRVAPFYWTIGLYGIGFVFSLVAVLGASWGRKSAYRILLLTFVFHTLAILARMYLQGRPPVTNLYSSAVFIGWGCVGLGLLLELVFKRGYALFAGSTLGFLTCLVAHNLDKNDSLEMMQAVLDTNFWLATHVVCITLGYVATAFAGILGILYVIQAVFFPKFDRDSERTLSTLTYVVLCIATLLSFVGTVLGGIWADQSWGRFWGWDPKENGAVLIVLWNALILHARWAGLVKSRGVAVLAVLGNAITMWSWFGTNQLGLGLHNYGFDSTLARWCTGVWFAHALLAGVGLVPRQLWASSKPAPVAPNRPRKT